MNREQIGTYLWVEILANDGRKTKSWRVWGRRDNYLGVIQWYGSWRGYVYHPSTCLLSPSCMRNIADFLLASTREHLQAKRDGTR